MSPAAVALLVAAGFVLLFLFGCLVGRILKAAARAELEPPDTMRRPAGCLCQWEAGDSPCPVHDHEPSEFRAAARVVPGDES